MLPLQLGPPPSPVLDSRIVSSSWQAGSQSHVCSRKSNASRGQPTRGRTGRDFNRLGRCEAMFPAKALCRPRKSHLRAGPCRRGHHLGTPGDFSEVASLGAATGSRNARPRWQTLIAVCCRTAINLLSTVLNSLAAFATASTSVSASTSPSL
jgi:hypothetical protein